MKGPFHNKTVIFGITGGIAAYKCCDVVRGMVKAGADVHVILTKAGAQFVTPLTLQTLSQNPVHTEMFAPFPHPPPRGGREWVGVTPHISLADRADIILVAPASADIIAKVACGICDELLQTVICATKAPVVFAPSMNVHMWENPIMQENIGKLKKLGYHFIEPATGDLACGYQGKGRLPEAADIIKSIEKILNW